MLPLKYILTLPTVLQDISSEFSLLDNICISDSSIELSDTGTTISADISIVDKTGVAVSWLPGISIMCGDSSTTVEGTAQVTIGSTFSARITVPVSIVIDSSLIVPVHIEDGIVTLVDDTYSISIDTGITISDGFAIAVDDDITLDLDPFMIGSTDVVVDFDNISFYLGDSAPDGESDDWRGVVIDHATLYLPSAITKDDTRVQIEADNLRIGNGGFSGTIGVDWTEDGDSGLSVSLAGVTATLTAFDMTFLQNTITASSIAGTLKLPFFDHEIAVLIGLTNDGDFTVALSSDSDDGLVQFETDFFTVELSALEIVKDGDTYYFVVSGSLTLKLGDENNLSLPTLVIDNLKIGSDGTIDVGLGGISLQQQTAIDLHGFIINVDAVSFGSDTISDQEYYFVSFSGGIQLIEPLPAGASAKGLRILWPRSGSGDIKIDCEGVAVNFEIPDTLRFAGAINFGDMPYTANGVEVGAKIFAGSVELEIIPTNLKVDAQLLVGFTNEATPMSFCFIQVGVDLPTGIALGSTGLALYGFNGMLAINMYPNKTTEQNWFEWLTASATNPAAADESETGIHAGKFDIVPQAFGFGVGTTLGTLFDNGYTFASMVDLVLLFPGPVIMLEGTGNLLKDRTKLTSDVAQNTFTSLIAFDGNDLTLLAALAMQFDLPKVESGTATSVNGALLTAQASSEAFFDFNDTNNWHVYMGEEDESKRIRATILKVLKADSYLMASAIEFKGGVRVGIDESFDYTVVSAALKALIEGSGTITWAPQHFSGTLQFDGEVSVSVAGFEFGLSATAEVEGASPHDRLLDVSLKLSVNMPSPLDDISFEIALHWEEKELPVPVYPLLQSASVRAYKQITTTDDQGNPTAGTESWALTVFDRSSMSDPDGFDSSWCGKADAVYPDARPLLVFNRSMYDGSGVGDPAPIKLIEQASDSVSFLYQLDSVLLHKWDGSNWQKVDDVRGSWQATGDAAGTELELFGDGPFSFMRQTIIESETEAVVASGSDSSGTSSSSGSRGVYSYIDTYLALHDSWPVSLATQSLYLDTTSVGIKTSPLALADSLWDGVSNETDSSGKPYPCELNVQAFADASSASHNAILLGEKIASSVEAQQLTIGVRVALDEAISLTSILMVHAGSGRDSHVEVSCTYKDGSSKRLSLTVSGSSYQSYAVPADMTDGVMAIELHATRQQAYLVGFDYIPMMSIVSSDAIDESIMALTASCRSLLEEDGIYRVQVNTSVKVSGATLTCDEANPRTYQMYFAVSAPPADLTPYIDSVVLANGGSAHFADYDIDVRFNENYINDMYANNLALQVVDENGAVVKYSSGWHHHAGSRPYYVDAWISSAQKALGKEFSVSEDAECDVLYNMVATSGSLPVNKTLTLQIMHQPSDGSDSPYTAPLYQQQFATSRYARFADLMAELRTDAWQQTVATTIAIDTTEDFDSVFYSTLSMPTTPLPDAVPELTSFNDGSSCKALYIAFPEPIEWERLTVALTPASGGSDISYSTIASQDDCRYLLVPDGTMTIGEYTFTATYSHSATVDLPELFLQDVSSSESVIVICEL